MSYRYDSLLVISNKFAGESADAKAQMFETYDQLRDITVSSANGAISGGLEPVGGFLYNMASLFAPSQFATSLNGKSAYAIPGTSYFSGGTMGSSSAGLENYSGFAAPIEGYATGEAASILTGYGTQTGAASSIGGITDIANAAAYTTGTASGYSGVGRSFLLTSAGLVSGIGGILQAAAPYMGEYGLGAILAGDVTSGLGGAIYSAVQNAAGKVTSNADTVLSNKVKNLETVCKMLDTQGDVVKKMLKESIDSDSKAIQNM